MGMGKGGSSQKYVAGYKYYAGAHMVLCHSLTNTCGGEIITQLTGNLESSYALLSTGRVLATFEEGSDYKVGQEDCANWTGIRQIGAQARSIIGVRQNGTLVWAGRPFNDASYAGFSDWGAVNRIVVKSALAVGITGGVPLWATYAGAYWPGVWSGIGALDNVVAAAINSGGATEADAVFLHADGTVSHVGQRPEHAAYQVAALNGQSLVQLACGRYNTFGLRSDGTVIGIGDNSTGANDAVSFWGGIKQICASLYCLWGLGYDGSLVRVSLPGGGCRGTLNDEDIAGRTFQGISEHYVSFFVAHDFCSVMAVRDKTSTAVNNHALQTEHDFNYENWSSESADRFAAIRAVMVGEKIAWGPGQLAHGVMDIDQPELFGGDTSEGGIAGQIDVMSGAPDQGANDYLMQHSGPVPGFRGVLSLVFKRFMFAMVNPYWKAWKFLVANYKSPWMSSYSVVQRFDENGTWQADIGMNPAHIIHGVLTSSSGSAQWGLGYSSSTIDQASFLEAAVTLYEEGFGINAIWDAGISAEDFLQDVLRYIDGLLFTHPRTGKFTLKLFRANYDVGELVEVDEHSIAKITKVSRPSWGEISNQVLLKWTEVRNQDGEPEKVRTCRMMNLAALRVQGQIVPSTVDCPYITDATLAAAVCERYLRQMSFPLSAIEFEGNRNLSDIFPGQIIKVSWDALGIDQMVVRVVEVSHGTLTDGRVTARCVEDMNGHDHTVINAPPETGWTPPDTRPVDCEQRQLFELPYHVLVNAFYSQEDVDGSNEAAGVVAALMGRPNGMTMSYKLWEWSAANSKYLDRNFRAFTPMGLLGSPISETTTEISIVDGLWLNSSKLFPDEEEHLALIGTELVLYKQPASATSDGTQGTCTISRGVLDTVPQRHAAGTKVWFINYSDLGMCQTVYLQTEQVRLKAAPHTSAGTLNVNDASENTLTMDARAVRPYPPANVRVNGYWFPGEDDFTFDEDLTTTWDNRHRKDQTGYVVEQDAGDIPAETGTIVNIYIRDADTDEIVRTVTGLDPALRTWTYTLAQEEADRGIRFGYPMYLEVETERDSWKSWQRYRVWVPEHATGTVIAWDIENLEYEDKSFGVGSQETTPTALVLSPDGTKLYVVGSAQDKVFQYALSTPWDVTTASYGGKNFSVAGQETAPNGFWFRPDGLKMYVSGNGSDNVRQYSLSTAWDVTTASYDSVTFNFNAQEPTPQGLSFSYDGSKAYVCNAFRVRQYTLSTPWDVSTMAYANKFFATSSQTSNVRKAIFNFDGTKMIVLDGVAAVAYQYSLSTPWDVTTATYDDLSRSMSEDSAPNGIYAAANGRRLYMVGRGSDTVYQYRLDGVASPNALTTQAGDTLTTQGGDTLVYQ